MFKRDINQQIFNTVVPLAIFLLALAPILFVFTEFKGRIALIVILSVVAMVFLINLVDLISSKAVVYKNTNSSVNKIIENTLRKLSDNVMRRFEKGNAGIDQQVALGQFCIVLLAQEANDLDGLENTLSKIFGVKVLLEYETKYVYIPALDDNDERSGNLTIKIGDHNPVNVKVW